MTANYIKTAIQNSINPIETFEKGNTTYFITEYDWAYMKEFKGISQVEYKLGRMLNAPVKRAITTNN